MNEWDYQEYNLLIKTLISVALSTTPQIHRPLFVASLAIVLLLIIFCRLNHQDYYQHPPAFAAFVLF